MAGAIYEAETKSDGGRGRGVNSQSPDDKRGGDKRSRSEKLCLKTGWWRVRRESCPGLPATWGRGHGQPPSPQRPERASQAAGGAVAMQHWDGCYPIAFLIIKGKKTNQRLAINPMVHRLAEESLINVHTFLF